MPPNYSWCGFEGGGGQYLIFFLSFWFSFHLVMRRKKYASVSVLTSRGRAGGRGHGDAQPGGRAAEWPGTCRTVYNWLNPRPSRRPAGRTRICLRYIYIVSNTRTGERLLVFMGTYERRSRARTHEFKYTHELFLRPLNAAAAAAASANPPASRKIYIHRAPRPSPRPPPVRKRAAPAPRNPRVAPAVGKVAHKRLRIRPRSS